MVKLRHVSTFSFTGETQYIKYTKPVPSKFLTKTAFVDFTVYQMLNIVKPNYNIRLGNLNYSQQGMYAVQITGDGTRLSSTYDRCMTYLTK